MTNQKNTCYKQNYTILFFIGGLVTVMVATWKVNI